MPPAPTSDLRRSWASGLLIVAAPLALAACCFAPVLFRDHLFGFRDAAHHYDPLWRRVQMEWQAGRLPLWDAWQNGGMPLLGNPTAAVLYPGKLAFALLPFAWGMRVFVVGHVLLACAGTLFLLRGQGRSRAASLVGGLTFAFGGPVLGLTNNLIYLVGAAWIPWGVAFASRWTAAARRRDLAAFALVLSLMVLGGEPQAALLTLVVASVLAVGRDRPRGEASRAATIRTSLLVVAGCATALLLAAILAAPLRGLLGGPARWLPPAAVALLLVALGRRAARRGRSWPRQVLALVAASVLALLVAAAQVLPTAEYVAASRRGGAGSWGFDRYGFSLVPYRLAELAWPDVLGHSYPRNHHWRSVLTPETDPTFWVPSLYLGGLALALAGVAVADRRARHEGAAGWSLLVLVAVLASFGLYAAPAGIGRWLPFVPVPTADLARGAAAADFQAGDGSPYHLLTLIVPGFDLFRYPSKLFTWAALGIAVLASIGCDALRRGPRAPVARVALAIAALGLVLLVASFPLAPWLEGVGRAHGRASPQTGPFEPGPALAATRLALLHGSLAMAAAAALARIARRRPRLLGPAVVALVLLDLALTQPGSVWTVPRETLEGPSRAARQMADDRGATSPDPGPTRIHRFAAWHPFGWFRRGSDDRLREVAAWERDTLQPLAGLPLDVSTTLTLGVMEDESYLEPFLPWLIEAEGASAAALGLAPGTPFLYHPRRLYDLWGARYFLLPSEPLRWTDENRANAAFLDGVSVVAPDVEALRRAGTMAGWRIDEDWQLLRNERAFPRAWVVHEVQVIPTLRSMEPRQRSARIRNFVYEADRFWNEPGRPVVDPRRVAWVESDDPARDRPAPAPVALPADAPENVAIVRSDPGATDLDVRLAAAGLVVLAEADAPGWTAILDGAPIRIWRTNLGMRGVAVPAGSHRLTFRYAPASVRVGLAGTILGLVALLALAAWPSRLSRREG